MIRVTLEIRDVKEGLPEKSGYYLCYTGGYWSAMHYSAMHGRFNAWDDKDPIHNEIYVSYWAEPELPKPTPKQVELNGKRGRNNYEME